MSHLKKRLCLISINDLTDCPGAIHHAIGSPYFNASGMPTFPEPIVVAVKADIADEALPRCSTLAVSCNTRPYQSYGPVMRTIFEKSQPHKHTDVRLGMEGVMEVASVREIPPGELSGQTDRILLGCIAPMTGKTNPVLVYKILTLFAQHLAALPPGSTLRMPLIGTGKARSQAASDELFKNIVSATIERFLPVLVPPNDFTPIRRLILVHPFDYESSLIAATLAEKSIFLTILDKLGIQNSNKYQVYGIAHGEKEENRIVEEEKFAKALDCFDRAIDLLLKGDLKAAIRESSNGVEEDPSLNCMHIYISSLASGKQGLLEAILGEAMSFAEVGQIRHAYSVATALNHLNPSRKQQDFIQALRDCYIYHCVAATEARLLYENYMETEQFLQAIYNGVDITNGNTVESNRKEYIPEGLMSNIEPLKNIEEKISSRIMENTFHIVIRKFMADEIELSGARRALDNVIELKKFGKIQLCAEDEKTCMELYDLADYIKQNSESTPSAALRQTVLEKLLVLLPQHGTLRLEAGRHYLSGGKNRNEKLKSVTRAEIIEAWSHFEIGYHERQRDYGLLSYMGFIILMQGGKFLIHAEEFFNIFTKLLDDELLYGRFAIRKLKAPNGNKIDVELRDERSKLAYEYYEKYRENAALFAKLSRALYDSEGTAAISLYHQAIATLSEIGRYDLAQLYEEILGETWVVLLCRNRKSLGSIPIPLVGEISLDFIAVIYKKIRFFWRFNRLRTPKVHDIIKDCIAKMGEKIRASK